MMRGHLNVMFYRLIWSIVRATKFSLFVMWIQARRKTQSSYSYPGHDEYTVEEHGYTDWSLYRTSKPRLQIIKNVAESLEYSIRQRGFHAVSGLCAVDSLDIPYSPKVLLIGYREDTYDAQGLTELGFHPQVEYLDINPAPEEEILRSDSFNSFKVLKRDAKQLGKELNSDRYDLIYFSMGCLDLFMWEDALKTLNEARGLARTAVIAHINSIFWHSPFEYPESIAADDWLVLDLLGDDWLGTLLESKLWDHLSEFAMRSGSNQIRHEMDTASRKGEIIRSISMNRSDDTNRILSLSEFPGSPELCSVQLTSSPLSKKTSYYMSSVLLWRTLN